MKAIARGAFVGTMVGIVSVTLLTVIGQLLLGSRIIGIREAASHLVFWLILSGPITLAGPVAVAGGLTGGLIHYWHRRRFSRNRLALYAGLLGMVLGSGVSFLCLGLRFLLAVIIHHSYPLDWLRIFLSLFMIFLPYTSLSSFFSGLFVAVTIPHEKYRDESSSL